MNEQNAASPILEALVGHVYVVGGRAIGSAPPGTLAFPAPRRAPRPRQEETFFALLVPNGGVRLSANEYADLARQAADTYFKTTGGITGGLRETFTALNRHLLTQQQALMQPLRVSLACAVMNDQELYVGRCGPMLTLFRDSDQLAIFPSDRANKLSISPPLGAAMEARPELTRYDLKPNCLLVLADDSFAHAPDEKLLDVMLSASDISTLLEPLRGLISVPMAHAMVVQFVTEDMPTPSTAAPVTVGAPIPASPTPSPAQQTAPSMSQTPPIIEAVAQAQKPLEAAPPKSETKPLTPIIQEGVETLRRRVADTLTDVAESTDKLGEKIFPEPPSEKEQNPLLSNGVVLLAVLLPLLVVVMVVGLALSHAGETDYEVCRAEVVLEYETAQQLNPPLGAPLDDANATLAYDQWRKARDAAQSCERLRPGDVQMRQIAGEAQNNLDRFERVDRREVTALRRFSENANLRGPVSSNWITLYTLDRANGEVYQDTLSDDGRLLTEVSTRPIIFRGQNISGRVVGEMVDLDWMLRGGLPGGVSNVPIILDSSGLLIWYNETFQEAQSWPLVNPPTWGRPAAMATWRLNLYILDPPAQQIWRYVPNNGVYSETPEEYFSGGTRPDITGALDFGIDEEGNVYILFQNGQIRKFIGGAERPFAYFNLPEGALSAGNSIHVDNNPLTRGMLVTDPANHTLYSMSLGGTVERGYRPLNILWAFDDISGALSNANRNSIYVLSGVYLYYMPRQ